MRVRFQGMSFLSNSGCGSCGSAASPTVRRVYEREFYLPSGGQVFATVGSPVEVDDSDGEYLLGLTQTVQGVSNSVFKLEL